MSQKFLKKEQAVVNLTGSAPRINFLKEKLTAFLLLVFVFFVVYQCSKNPKEKKVIISANQNLKKQVSPKKADKTKEKQNKNNEKKEPVIDSIKGYKNDESIKTKDEQTEPLRELPIQNKEVKVINTNLKTSGNIVSWNPALNIAAKEIRISFIDSKGRKWVSDANVTGRSTYTYNPSDGRAGNISTKVVLSLIKNEGYKIEGKTIIENEYFECSSSEK
jgi:hypothetical protein